MAWSAPRTWVTGEIVTAAHLNQEIRDNLLTVTPAGAITGYGALTAPSGWLLCDGTAVSRTTYAALFAAIAAGYGAGDGSTTFNLPDLRGRTAVGLGTHADVSALANGDGLAVGSRRPKHKHTFVQPTISRPSVTVTDPGHKHEIKASNADGSDAWNTPPDEMSDNWQSRNAHTQDNTTGITAALAADPVASGGTVGPQTGSEPLDSEAYLVVNYIIKT
jgi:microcystin-dependent protein